MLHYMDHMHGGCVIAPLIIMFISNIIFFISLFYLSSLPLSPSFLFVHIISLPPSIPCSFLSFPNFLLSSYVPTSLSLPPLPLFPSSPPPLHLSLSAPSLSLPLPLSLSLSLSPSLPLSLSPSLCSLSPSPSPSPSPSSSLPLSLSPSLSLSLPLSPSLSLSLPLSPSLSLSLPLSPSLSLSLPLPLSPSPSPSPSQQTQYQSWKQPYKKAIFFTKMMCTYYLAQEGSGNHLSSL